MSEYKPVAWAIIRFRNGDEDIYKVMGGWYGGYLYGDSWRLNSGIVEVIDKGDTYEFVGASGSIYICDKANERFTGLMASVYQGWKNVASDKIEIEAVKAEDYINVNT